MLTCSQQIDSKIFAYMKHIRPRHAIIVDQQKAWPRFSASLSTTEPAGRQAGRCSPDVDERHDCRELRYSRRQDS
jgi:hypothetical protein